MKLNRLDFVVWGVLAALGLALAALLLAGDRVGARAMQLFPADGGTAGSYSRIGVEFAQTMITRTVESGFHLSPETPGHFQWEGQTLWFVPEAPLSPGRYTAQLAAGQSLEGRPIKGPLTWSFSVRTPEIVYLSLAAEGGNELWRMAPPGGAPVQVTHTQGRVYDYDVAHSGDRLVYSARNDQGGADLWQLERDESHAETLVNCGADTCSMPAWAPQDTRLAYIRQPPGPSSAPRLWTVDMSTGQTAPLYQDPQISGSEPSWSPNGEWLAFFDRQANGLRVLNVQTSESVVLPSLMGQVGGWSPDSQQLAFADIKLGGPQIANILQVADMQARSIRLIIDTDRGWSDFGPPAWSPAGDWLVLSLRTAEGGVGKQLWLMRPDGTGAQAVTHAPNYTHGSYHWDAAGKALLFQRYDLSTPNAAPEIMLWQGPSSGEPRRLVTNAALPRWLP